MNVSIKAIKNNTMNFKIISHRGRVENSKYPENSLDALKKCLDMGLSIEIDVTKKQKNTRPYGWSYIQVQLILLYYYHST